MLWLWAAAVQAEVLVMDLVVQLPVVAQADIAETAETAVAAQLTAGDQTAQAAVAAADVLA